MKKRKKVSRNRRNISESKRIRRTNKLFATFPFVLLLLLLIALLLIYKPILTGLVTSEKEISFDDTINAEFTSSSEYLWQVKNLGDIKSIKISGNAQNNTIARVYAGNEKKKYLFFAAGKLGPINGQTKITPFPVVEVKEGKEKDSKEKNKSEEIKINETEPINQTINITPIINDTITNETLNLTPIINETFNATIPLNDTIANGTIANETLILPINKSIIINLKYKNGTSYDAGNDGIESVNNIIDFTVEDTSFNWAYDISKLCTRWEMFSIDDEKATTVCYGSEECCALLSLKPTRNSWNEPLYLSYNLFGASHINIVSSQVIYANSSDIILSEWGNLTAKFEEEGMFGYSNVCLDTCSVSGFNKSSYKLIIEVEKGKLVISNINYAVRKLVENTPQQLAKEIVNYSIKQDSSLTINLSEYFNDADNDELHYSYYKNDNFGIIIEDNTAVITPAEGFSGEIYTFFTANDSESIAVSNVFLINVAKEKELTQLKAEINKPVAWLRKVLSEQLGELKVAIPEGAFNITVENEQKTRLSNDNIQVNEKGHLKSLDDYELNKSIEKIIKKLDKEKSKKKPNADKITELEKELNEMEKNSMQSIEFFSNVTNETQLIVSDNSTSFDVTFSTPAPEVVEEEKNEHTKLITISSELSYENILAYTTIQDAPQSAIKLYWIKDGAKELFTDVAYNDTNGNGLIDYVEWVVPHLSNQTFEITITILNVQSYPTVGGNWTVGFTTTGTGNLTVIASNGTTYAEKEGDDANTINDLDILELKCKDNVLFNYNDLIINNNVYLINENDGKIKINDTLAQTIGIKSLVVENFRCGNSTSLWAVKVLTTGKHTQQFNFSGQIAYANNLASVNSTNTSNLTIWDDTDTLLLSSFESINFYANFTNITSRAPINGSRVNCTFSENATGGWSDAVNMTFNATKSLYQYNMTFSNIGIFTFNVTCRDETYGYANVTANDTFQVGWVNVTETLNATNVQAAAPIGIFGHINLSNGTNVSNTGISLFINKLIPVLLTFVPLLKLICPNINLSNGTNVSNTGISLFINNVINK